MFITRNGHKAALRCRFASYGGFWMSYAYLVTPTTAALGAYTSCVQVYAHKSAHHGYMLLRTLYPSQYKGPAQCTGLVPCSVDALLVDDDAGQVRLHSRGQS